MIQDNQLDPNPKNFLNLSDLDPHTDQIVFENVVFPARSELTEVRMQQLQMIRGSPSYADRLADTIKQKLRLVDKVGM